MYKFSVLTATYNCSKYIESCIQSVLKQEYDFEMIIVDDCSKDNTFDIAKSFTDQRIKVYRNEKRLGCGLNYGKILSLANGQYCGVLDGDDQLIADSISTICECYKSHPKVDFIWTEHLWGNTELQKFRNGLSKFASKGTIFDSEDSLKHAYSHWRTFKTEMRDRGTIFRDLKCTVDKDLGYNLEELGQGAFLKKQLYLYRYHKENMSHNSSQRQNWRLIRKYHKKRPRKYRIIEL